MKKNIKVYHGPLNTIGLGGYISSHLKLKGIKSEFVTYKSNDNFSNYDKTYHWEKKNVILKILIPIYEFFRVIFRFNVFNFYFGTSFFIFNLDLPILKLMGKK